MCGRQDPMGEGTPVLCDVPQFQPFTGAGDEDLVIADPRAAAHRVNSQLAWGSWPSSSAATVTESGLGDFPESPDFASQRESCARRGVGFETMVPFDDFDIPRLRKDFERRVDRSAKSQYSETEVAGGQYCHAPSGRRHPALLGRVQAGGARYQGHTRRYT